MPRAEERHLACLAILTFGLCATGLLARVIRALALSTADFYAQFFCLLTVLEHIHQGTGLEPLAFMVPDNEPATGERLYLYVK
jgi:hypothetical protein